MKPDSPLPFAVHELGITDAKGALLCEGFGDEPNDLAYLVHAANCHPALTDALKRIADGDYDNATRSEGGGADRTSRVNPTGDAMTRQEQMAKILRRSFEIDQSVQALLAEQSKIMAEYRELDREEIAENVRAAIQKQEVGGYCDHRR